MGYTTDFSGSLTLTPALTQTQMNYINKFSNTCRMGRNVDELMKKFKGKQGLPLSAILTNEQQSLVDELSKQGFSVSVKRNIDTRTADEIYGKEGEFFVGDETTGVIDNNTPPGQVTYKDNTYPDRYVENQRREAAGECQPGLWCQWVIQDDKLEWDGNEKFYNYEEWLQYMITNFFKPWGITLNGEIEWQGEDSSDFGKIVVTDNVMTILNGTKVFG